MTGNRRRVVILQHRDIRLLRELAVMRVIDREQAKLAAGFGSTTRVNARLLLLTRSGILRRFFWGEVTGPRKGLYALSAKGAQLVGVPERGPRRRRDQVLGADFFSIHQLAVNDIYCTLKHRPLPADIRFVQWMSFYEPLNCTQLIPDGYAELLTPGRVHALFFEVDLGTENRKKWQQKVQQYLTFATSGNFSRDFGSQQFRTLVVANSETRLRALQGATADLTEKIFRFTTSERIARQTFWGPIWQKPLGQELETLI